MVGAVTSGVVPVAPIGTRSVGPAPEPQDTTASILVVDDDEGSLRALSAVLEPLGQKVLTARSGDEALRRLLHHEFAAILLDMRMPGLDGLQTAAFINARPRTRRVPIIFLTAHAEDMEQVFRAYAAGAVDYVVKPVDPDVLRSKVAVFVELQRERWERVREARARSQAEAVAGALQRHLLPDRLPIVPGMRMASRYRPSERVALVGGDWYDAIELPTGGIGLVIGDVVGHGVQAATLMGELRAALRAYAVAEPCSPAAVLTSLNALVASTHRMQMVATLLYMVVDEDGTRARFASAGHLPPLVIGADRDTFFLEHRHDPPLGADEKARFSEWEGELADSTVLLYTDGLVERRGETLDVGLARLREAVSEGPTDLEQLCSHVLDQAVGGGDARDDIALLAAQLAGADERTLEFDLPAEPASVPAARHRIERWLERTGGGRDDLFAIKLAVSEVCANAVEHAYGPGQDRTFHVRAERVPTAAGERPAGGSDERPAGETDERGGGTEGRGGEVVIEVSDSGRWRRPRGSQRGRGLHIIRQLMDTVHVEQAAGGTTVRMSKAPTHDEQLPPTMNSSHPR
jgi:serine phosphatase RsbU (regulator of sigma subunit)/anti-sigma regulatory factor (Ser/Thr protein kinase)